MAQHNELGNRGEKIAIDYLIKNNYKILTQNYRYDRAEVDILAQKDELLVVIEVKTRSSIQFGNPKNFVKPKQIERLVKAVNAYLEKNDLDLEVRFDIIGILTKADSFKIEHTKDAFYHF